MNSIRPTTTPTLYVAIDADITDHEIELTLQDKHIKFVYAADRLTKQATDTGCLITATMTAEETRALIPGSQARVQLRAEKDGNIIATNIGSVPIDEILNSELL